MSNMNLYTWWRVCCVDMNSDMIIEDEDEVTVGTEERIFDIERMIESPE